ncbi:MAG: molybdopterin-synthase adenylyltransferase MoeB [Planctomycetes bacterium]|nr:molybdopterin-synthase adenylyltransferase MoeB [Planctomycetota bacterium]
MPSKKDAWIEALRGEIPQISPREVQELLDREGASSVMLVDVREGEEFRAGHLPGAVHLPRGSLELEAESKLGAPRGVIVAYCAEGVRSLFAARTLESLGFRDVRSMEGGVSRWRQEGLPLEMEQALTARERERYARHLAIDEVGEEGQLRLKKARVLCVGAGGLGSPAAFYLAAAGVGTLGIVDGDVVDRSNLQRQILHRDDRVGELKVDSARKTLEALNPDIRVEAHPERLTSANIDAIIEGCDIVVDGSDNFPTRYLLSDACVKHGKPNVHGSVHRFEGQVTVFWPGRGPCYRCLFLEPPPPEMAPPCAEAGVLGVVPGVIGVLEAIEAIKIILGKGELLLGRLLTYDALEARFREIRIRRDPACAYCGAGRTFPGYVDYQRFCSR